MPAYWFDSIPEWQRAMDMRPLGFPMASLSENVHESLQRNAAVSKITSVKTQNTLRNPHAFIAAQRNEQLNGPPTQMSSTMVQASVTSASNGYPQSSNCILEYGTSSGSLPRPRTEAGGDHCTINREGCEKPVEFSIESMVRKI